jgi:hypothetical protein
MEKVGAFFGYLEYITTILYILWPFGNLVAFGTFSTVLVHCFKKNLATQVYIYVWIFFSGSSRDAGKK